MYQKKLYAAFIGKSTNTIYVCSSPDGISWSNHTTIFNHQSACPPSLAVFNNKLYLAWTGTTGGPVLIVYYDGTDWHNGTSTDQTSAQGPALAVFNNKLYLAFIANDGSNKLMICSSSDGSHWSPAAPIPGQSSQSNPSLATCGGRLWLAYMGNSNHQLHTWSTTDPDNAKWTPTAFNNTSCAAPSLAVFNENLWIAFAGDTTKDLFYCSYDAKSDKWSGLSSVTGQKSQVGPALIQCPITNNLFSGTPSFTAVELDVVFVSMDGSDTLMECSSPDGNTWTEVRPVTAIPTTITFNVPDTGYGSGPNNCNFFADLILNWDGTCEYEGTYNNTGSIPIFTAPAQSYSVVMAVFANGIIYTFEQDGVAQNAKSDSWNITVKNPDIAEHWADLTNGTIMKGKCNNYANPLSGLGGLISAVGDALSDIVNDVKTLWNDTETVIEAIGVIGGSIAGAAGGQTMISNFNSKNSNPSNSNTPSPAVLLPVIHVYVNGTLVPMDVAPKFVDGRYLVQMRPLFEALGAADPTWDQSTQTIIDTMGSTKIKMTIGSTTAYINGNPHTLAAPPQLDNGHTLIPARFVSEAFGYNINYDAADKQLDITSKS
jgi:hypothetical protein